MKNIHKLKASIGEEVFAVSVGNVNLIPIHIGTVEEIVITKKSISYRIRIIPAKDNDYTIYDFCEERIFTSVEDLCGFLKSGYGNNTGRG